MDTAAAGSCDWEDLTYRGGYIGGALVAMVFDAAFAAPHSGLLADDAHVGHGRGRRRIARRRG